MTTTKRTPTLDQAMDDHSDAWVFRRAHCCARRRGPPPPHPRSRLTRLRFAVIALVDSGAHEELVKACEEHVADMAECGG